MSQEYRTLSGRVSRPPLAFGAQRPDEPEGGRQTDPPRTRRTKATFAMPESSESGLTDFEAEHRMASPMRVIHEDQAEDHNVRAASGQQGDAVSEMTETGRPNEVRRSAEYPLSEGGRSQSGTEQPEGRYPVETSYDTAPSSGQIVEIDLKPSAPHGAGSSAEAPKGSLRSPEWLREMGAQLEKDRAEWNASRERERLRQNARDRSMNYYNSSILGLSKHTANNRESEPPRPTVLVPGTPESDATQPSQRSGKVTDPLARVPDPLRPQARGPRNIKNRGQGFWDVLKKSVKPVQEWLADVSVSAAQNTNQEPVKVNEDPAPETEYEMDEETVEFIQKFSTPKKEHKSLENNEGSEDVDMTDRIPAQKKGKSRDPTWGIQTAQPMAAVTPSVAPRTEKEADRGVEQDTVLTTDPGKPTSILKLRPEDAVRRGKERERELEEQLAKERRDYERAVAETEDLQLRIAIRESELEAQKVLAKQRDLEEALRRSRAESHARREGEPSRPRKKVEIAKDAKPPTDAVLRKERPSTRAKEGATTAPAANPKTTELAKRITGQAKALTEKMRKADDKGTGQKGSIEPTPSTMTAGSGHSRGPLDSQSAGSGRSRGGKDEDETLTEQEGHSRSSSPARSESTTPKDTSSESDDDKHDRKKRKKKSKDQRRAAIKAVHLNKPRTYNGEAIYDKYEAWMEDFDDWRNLHDLDEYGTMISMSLALTGKAKEWYNLNVKGHEKEWTLAEVSEQMFEDLFPANFASILRQTFEDARQRENSLKEWYKYLVKLSKRVQFVDEHELRRRFWNGSAMYLQKEWAKIGLKPEDASTTVEEMIESGLRFERARGYELEQEKRSPFNTRGLRESTSKPRPNDYLYKEKPQLVSRKEQARQKKHQNAQSGPSKEQKHDNKTSNGGRKSEKKKLTEEEKEELRADDRCFECGKQGHIARNCPHRREATPPKKKGRGDPPVYNGSMQFEGTTRKKREPVLRLGMMELGDDSEGRDEDTEDAADEVARERATLMRAIILSYLHEELAQVEPPFEWQRNSPMRPYRFEFGYARRGVIRIWDTWRNWYAFIREELFYEDGFSISAWVNERDLTEPRILNDPPPLPEDGHEIPESEEEEDGEQESTDSELEERSTDSDDDAAPEMMSIQDTDSEGDDAHSVAPSDSDEPSAAPSESGESTADPSDDSEGDGNPHNLIGCSPIQPTKPRGKLKARKPKAAEKFWESLEDNSNVVKNDKRTIPHPIILTVYVNGKACRALLDSGAYSDFLSTTLVDNLGLKRKVLPTPLTLQMAVQGSRSKINATTTVEFQYSTIKCEKTFDIVNIASYDIILGTTFIWQHKVVLGMNPTRIAIGSNEPLKIEGTDAHTIMGALAMEMEDNLEEIRNMLRKEAKELCEDAAKSALPPFRAINHKIPLIDETKTYKFRPSKCPRALEPLWREKSGEYLRSGRWRMATGSNPIPVLILQKQRKDPNDPIRVRTCFDKREQNANTRKLASPMPDQTEVLERVAARKYRTVIDGRDAYEQIRVEKEDVWKTLFNTPDGLMESLVLQQGDCNGPATYQSLMNYLFAGHIGVWMDVYLDDIIIYSDTLKDHIAHVRMAFKILKREKLFLNPKKMQFIAPDLEVLGHRVTDDGIKMDPYKVDSIKKWPVPTCKDLLGSFIGAVGYLADGVRGIRIPMAVLNKITGSTKLWRWGPTEQRSFEQVKELVHTYREKTRVPLSYAKDAPMIWLVTDASMTGAAGHVCQGEDWKTAKPVAFWSGKFSSAEQAYPTHEQELLAIVESLKRFRHHLLGAKFTIVTDHEKLDRFMTQKDLSRRQIRWLETLCDFDFEIKYSPGKLNILADALSRIYSNDGTGTERATSEYVTSADPDEEPAELGLFNMEPTVWPSRPILVGREVAVELLAMNVTRPQLRHNPDRMKSKGISLREESGSEDSPETAIAPKRQHGRPRKSVLRPTRTSSEVHAEEESSVAPGSSGESEMSSPIRPRAAPAKKWFNTSDEGESEVDEPNPSKERREKNERRETGKSDDRRSTETQKRKSFEIDPDDEGESEMEDSPPKQAMVEERNPGELARDELREADKALETGQLPDPNGNREATGVRLTDIISDIEIPGDLEGRYAEDTFFAKVLENPTHYINFEVVGKKGKEIVYKKDPGALILCIPDIMVGSRKAREVVITHAHSILAHLGARKTLWYLRDNVWWKEMVKDITDYCTSCEICARTKSTNQKPMGLLHPLKVPKRPWEQIGVDFVGPLPEARNRYGSFDQVMVVIDHLTSMVHIVPVKTSYRARQVAEVFYETVYKLHGLPERMVSDRDKIFTSTFWKNLHRLINVEIKMSSTYHPQTDGATERANRTMVQMIRQAIGEKDTRWLEKLPSIEWAMNAARSETTGFSPFFLNYGHRPRPLIWNNAEKDSYPGVHAFAQRLKDAIMTAHDAILERRVKQTRQANRGRRPSAITVGDLVYLSTKNLKLPKGKSRKLVPKFIGPYRVTKELSAGATYKLELPKELVSRGVNNAFHASLLRIHIPNCDTRFPGRQIPQLSAFGVADEGLEVENIRTHSGRGEDALFELIWKNGEATWEPLNRVKGLEALVEYLEAMGVRRVENLPPGAGKPPSDDPEIFLGAMSAIEFDPEHYKRTAHDERISPAQSPPPKATPLLSTSTRIHPTMSSRRVNYNDLRRVGKKRQDTPHPYHISPPRVTTRAPTGPKFSDEISDSLDIAVAVAKASTTDEMATTIDKIIGKIPATRRKTIRHLVESNPSAFYSIIDMPNIADRTAKSVDRKVPRIRAGQPSKALAEDATKPLIPVFTELLNNSKMTNTYLQELLNNQRACKASTSTSKDPRKVTQTPQEPDLAFFLAEMGIPYKEDAEMVDAAGGSEETEAHGQTEDWLEEPPVDLITGQDTNAN